MSEFDPRYFRHRSVRSCALTKCHSISWTFMVASMARLG